MKRKTTSGKTRIAAVADIHVKAGEKEQWIDYFRKVSKEADILALCGDLTDGGTETEAKALAEALKTCSIPVVAVFGNHDYEAEKEEELKEILTTDRVHVLDGESVIIDKLGFAGVKGFGGGFDKYTLPLYGEKMNKMYVKETVKESLKLDKALSGLASKHVAGLKKIVLLHYSPIKSTLKGEPEQIYPFLGSSRLAEPVDGRDVAAVFHGHAHWGILEGKTKNNVKVYNVSIPVLHRSGYPKHYFILEL